MSSATAGKEWTPFITEHRRGSGEKFTVTTSAGSCRTVDSVTTYTKSSLKDSAVWSVVPNRLVLISCYTGDLWGKN